MKRIVLKRFTTNLVLLAAALVLAGIAPITQAKAAPKSSQNKVYKEDLGKKTVCPITGEEFTVTKDSKFSEYKGKRYYFCCPKCKPTFDKDPASYITKVVPVDDIGTKRTCPVMKNELTVTDKTTFTYHNGEYVYYCCPGCKEKFEKDPEKYGYKPQAKDQDPKKHGNHEMEHHH